jgi:hypothetical protein
MQVKAKKKEEKKPQKAQDAGARGRRMLQRREYAAKISGSEDRVPDDLRDSVQYDENLDNIKTAVSGAIKKVGKGLKDFINKPVMPNYPTEKQYKDAVKSGTSNQYQSYEPEGEMIEAKIDKIDPKNKRNRRNVAKFGPQTKPYDPPTKEMKTSMGKFMQKTRQDMHKAKRGVKQEEVVLESDKKGKGSGTKDACYHKVKSRYSVWPSAYASGALVKCRKVGAKNWGNSSKKEEVNWDFEMKSFGAYADECWKTHKQVGTKMKGGKVVPNCVPKNEEVAVEDHVKLSGSAKKEYDKLVKIAGDKNLDMKKRQGADAALTQGGHSSVLNKEEKKKLSNTSPLSDRVSNWSKTKIKEGAGVKRDQNMPYIPNQKIKTVKDKPLRKVPYGALAQSYVPQGETIDEKRKLSRLQQAMIKLDNKKGANIKIPDQMKNKLNKNPLDPPVDGV